MKNQTIRFYTDSRIYMGWKYLKNTTHREIISWVRSGNYIIVGKNVFSWKNRSLFIVEILDKKIFTVWDLKK